MMRVKLISIAIATIFVLFGCQGNNNQEGTGTNNIQPTRYDENLNRNNRMNEGIQNNRQYPNDNINQHQADRYDVSEEAAQKIVDEMDDIEAAYVLTTENNAYVAAVLDNDNNGRATNENDLTQDIKEEISDIVRSIDDDIDNVYVSTNPDFVDLTNDYITDFNEGRPIRGFFDQIGDMIERIFPQNRAE